MIYHMIGHHGGLPLQKEVIGNMKEWLQTRLMKSRHFMANHIFKMGYHTFLCVSYDRSEGFTIHILDYHMLSYIVYINISNDG
jgi:hypothetical protein